MCEIGSCFLNIEGGQEDMLQNSRVAGVIGTGRIQVERGGARQRKYGKFERAAI
jgi:hypothetical protein